MENIELPDIGDNSLTSSQLNVEWTEEHEKIIIEWADKAMCFRWLHSKCHSRYSKANAWFTIPVIIMSTITGAANFAQERLSDELKQYSPLVIGSINIFAGILTTIQQFLKIGELNEAHRIASISWDKFFRNAKVELAKSPNERVPVIQMLKHSKEEYDRLMETSPDISNKVIEMFKNTFSDGLSKLGDYDEENLTENQRIYLSLKKPEICDTLESTANIVYKKSNHVTANGNKTATTLSAIALARKAVELKKKQDKVEKIINTFYEQKGRTPTTEEIMDELDGEISRDIIEKMLQQTEHTQTN